MVVSFRKCKLFDRDGDTIEQNVSRRFKKLFTATYIHPEFSNEMWDDDDDDDEPHPRDSFFSFLISPLNLTEDGRYFETDHYDDEHEDFVEESKNRLTAASLDIFGLVVDKAVKYHALCELFQPGGSPSQFIARHHSYSYLLTFFQMAHSEGRPMLQQVYDKIAASAETVKELQQGEIILPKTVDDDDDEHDEHADDEQDENDGKQNLFDIFIRAVANICHQATFQLDGQLYQIFNFVKQTGIEKKFLDLTNSSTQTNKRYSSFGPGRNEIEPGDTMLMHVVRHVPFESFAINNLINMLF